MLKFNNDNSTNLSFTQNQDNKMFECSFEIKKTLNMSHEKE